MINHIVNSSSSFSERILTNRKAWIPRIIMLYMCIFPCTMTAQRLKKVCGEYTYYAEAHESQNDAYNKALEGARNNALGKEFGTKISQTTTQEESSDDGVEHSFFAQLSTLEVEGEWIEDVGEPVYNVSVINNQIVVKCTVCGRARKKSNRTIEFEATVLRAYPELQNADVHFRDKERIFLHFQAPANGYIAVYLVDEAHTASCLLPYSRDNDGQQKVKGGKDYIFFSRDKAEVEENRIVDQYTLNSIGEIERNMVYIIFSKKPFTKAVDYHVTDLLPRQLSYDEFIHWLHRQQAHDPEMGLKRIHIEIKK